MNEGPQRINALPARHLLEAETAKEFIARAAQGGSVPPGFPEKWRKPNRKGAYYDKRRVPKIRSTWQYRYPANQSFGLRYHGTDVLTWHRDGRIVTNNGGFWTATTFDRMNRSLPSGWYIYKFQGTYYWANRNFPPEMRPRRSTRLFRIKYTNGDWLDKKHNLNCSLGVVTPQGGTTEPVHHRPRQESKELADRLLEGSYHQNMDRQRRIEAKYKKIRQVEKLKRDLEKIDEPDKRRKKLNLH
jgi:hypothetical protein